MNKLFEACELALYNSVYFNAVSCGQEEKAYVELILLTEGGVAKHTAFYGEQMSLPAIIYIPEGLTDKFVADENARGYSIRFKSSFLPQSNLELLAVFFDACNLPLASFALQDAVIQLFNMMLCEFRTERADMRAIQYLLLALLAKIDFIRKGAGGNNHCKERDYLICKTFMSLLEANFSYNHKVDFYSKQLNVSLRSLNYITARVLGKSVLQLIDMRKQAEAQELLVNSSKSITEIAYELGFDKSYFSRFFYKKAGVTPMQFRQGRQKAVS